jgi:excinuclease ABC subunit B
LYADRITGSMQKAIAETERRRAKQIAFNKKHHITPKGIAKAVHDILEGARSDISTDKQRLLKVVEEQAYYATFSPEELAKKIKQLEREMLNYAKNLQFEEAAEVRDKLKKLKGKIIGID